VDCAKEWRVEALDVEKDPLLLVQYRMAGRMMQRKYVAANAYSCPQCRTKYQLTQVRSEDDRLSLDLFVKVD
jgi:hypothetical protein